MIMIVIHDHDNVSPGSCEEGPGLCAHFITFISLLIILATLPISLCFVIKVVQVRWFLVHCCTPFLTKIFRSSWATN